MISALSGSKPETLYLAKKCPVNDGQPKVSPRIRALRESTRSHTLRKHAPLTFPAQDTECPGCGKKIKKSTGRLRCGAVVCSGCYDEVTVCLVCMGDVPTFDFEREDFPGVCECSRLME